MSRTCATTRWPGRLEKPTESGLGATELLSGVSGLEVIVGGRARADVRVVVAVSTSGLWDVTT